MSDISLVQSSASHVFPLWLKILCLACTIVILASYSLYYSFAASFMWFSCIALMMTTAALWFEKALPAGMPAVGVMVLELVYTADFFWRVATGTFLTGLSVYFFQGEDSPFWVRAMSLFHIPLPFLLMWMLWKLGYDRRSLHWQSVLCWMLLPACYFFTPRADNVNWVFGPREHSLIWMPDWGWLVGLMLGFPLLIYLPTHLIFLRVFPRPRRAAITTQSEPRY